MPEKESCDSMTRYKPKSKFLKALLKKTEWKDRDKINDLLELEMYVLDNGIRKGWAHAMKMVGFESTYENELFTMMKELNPKMYRKYVKIEKEETGERKKIERDISKEDASAKRAWLKSGGRK